MDVAVGDHLGPDPRLADVVGFLRPEQLLAVAEAVVTTQRDFGDRANRKHARLKYTIDDRGLEWFVGEITRRQGFALPASGAIWKSSKDDTTPLDVANSVWSRPMPTFLNKRLM